MNQRLLLCAFSLALVLNCDDSGSAGSSGDTQIDLETELSTIGNLVSLPTAGSTTINGKVIGDEDGNPVGLDITGDNDANLVYAAGTFNVKSAGAERALNSVGFYIAPNEDDVFYFVADGSNLGISLDEESTDATVTIITNNDGSLAGLDTTGDGSVDAGTELEGLIPAFVGKLRGSDCFVGSWLVDEVIQRTANFSSDGTYTSETTNGDGDYTFAYESGTWTYDGQNVSFFGDNIGNSNASLSDAQASAGTAGAYGITYSAICEGDKMSFIDVQRPISTSGDNVVGTWGRHISVYSYEDGEFNLTLNANYTATYESNGHRNISVIASSGDGTVYGLWDLTGGIFSLDDCPDDTYTSCTDTDDNAFGSGYTLGFLAGHMVDADKVGTRQ